MAGEAEEAAVVVKLVVIDGQTVDQNRSARLAVWEGHCHRHRPDQGVIAREDLPKLANELEIDTLLSSSSVKCHIPELSSGLFHLCQDAFSIFEFFLRIMFLIDRNRVAD